MIGQERLNRIENKIDAINKNAQDPASAKPQAPVQNPQMDPSSNGTGSARPVFTQQTADDLDQINKGDAMSNVLFNNQQSAMGASMKKEDMKEVVEQLKGASKMHAQQAKKIQSLIKSKNERGK